MKTPKEILHALNFPHYPFKITRSGNDLFIYDELRQKKLKLTPEEWVRQHIIQYLIREKAFPKGLISLEKGIRVNQTQKRYDALIYDHLAQPLVLIECKASDVPISQLTFDQALVYNQTIRAKYILITNGLTHYCCSANNDGSYSFLKEIPDFKTLRES